MTVERRLVALEQRLRHFGAAPYSVEQRAQRIMALLEAARRPDADAATVTLAGKVEAIFERARERHERAEQQREPWRTHSEGEP
ncbi:MAG: hypothetical protein H0W08_06075 [Acidobacteria bacterium]|nr:hypothetical protein [Acidobacteriota bacterium]